MPVAIRICTHRHHLGPPRRHSMACAAQIFSSEQMNMLALSPRKNTPVRASVLPAAGNNFRNCLPIRGISVTFKAARDYLFFLSLALVRLRPIYEARGDMDVAA